MSRRASRSREFKRDKSFVDVEKASAERRARRQATREEIEAEEQKQEQRKRDRQEAIRRYRARMRGRMLVYAVVVILLLVVLAASLWNIVSVRMQYNVVQQENEALVAEKKALEEKLGNVNDPEYVEQEARAILRMTKPGEMLYIFPEKD